MNDLSKKIDRIKQLKKEKNAVILAHFYQTSDIQDIADYVGDSLGLAQQAEKSSADIIVFAGVHFMAETAKIINPKAKVLIPELEVGCSLADSCKYEDFKKFKSLYPDHKVISYINCTAEQKTLTDVVCTSTNAMKIVEDFDKDQKLIFAPDRNLGGYINKMTGRNMILWDGSCEVHDLLTIEKIIALKEKNPEAKLIAHPECKGQILELADFVGSTTALLNYTIKNEAKVFIVATETGILYNMKNASPDKEFIIAPGEETCACNDCPYMKMITLDKILVSLEEEKYEVKMSDQIMKDAKKSIDTMMEISRKNNLV